MDLLLGVVFCLKTERITWVVGRGRGGSQGQVEKGLGKAYF